jgi:TatD DNase family protein
MAKAAGIDRLVQCGCELPSAVWTSNWLREREAAGVPSDQPSVVGAIAIHPNEAVLHAGVHEIAKDGLEPRFKEHHDVPLDEAIAAIGALASANPMIRAIGETGMDLFRAGPRGAAVQREAFRAHIALAKELGLALQIHDREAHSEVIEVLLADGAPERTVFHCFSGDAAMAEFCAKQGWYLSFAGPVSYPANKDMALAAQVVPSELILVETDAPYLTPHPFRGQPNSPFAANYTVRALAELRGIPAAEFCEDITRNSVRVYGDW